MSTKHRSRLVLTTISVAAILGIVAPIASALPPPLPPIKRPAVNQPRPQQHTQAARSKASLIFDKDIHDFGRIFDSEKQQVNFGFTNQGSEDLVISLIKPTCGCTLANIFKISKSGERVVLDSTKPDDMTFAPGERGLIDITFNPAGKKGEQNRKVNIFSNDQQSQQRSVAIKGFVRPVVQFDPPLISFGSLDVGNGKTISVRVMGLGDEFEASHPTFAQMGNFTVKVLGTEVTEYQGDTLRATTIEVSAPDNLKPGTYNNTMHVRTNDSRKRIIDIPVFVVVKGPIEVVPPRLAIGNIRVDQTVNRSFLIRSRGKVPFKITSMKLDRKDLSGLEFTATPRTEGDLTQYVVSVSGSVSTPMARTTATLKITTDLKEHNTLELPMILGVIQ